MPERLISERLTPITEEVAAHGMVPGAPLLPSKFIWRGQEVAVKEVVEKWKETGPCRHGSGERYVRKHWFRIRTSTNEEMKIYFERQARSAKQMKLRWWLYTITATPTSSCRSPFL